jgi:hypothetical protein
MATRATYTFKSDFGDKHIYIHWDGYPEGAAQYFQKMMELREERRQSLSDLRGGLTEQFIRANRGAEFTSHWEDHGDTEWHYEVGKEPHSAITLKVIKFSYDDSGERMGQRCFEGPLTEFIGKYLQESNDHAN